jgi:hypothetical protein
MVRRLGNDAVLFGHWRTKQTMEESEGEMKEEGGLVNGIETFWAVLLARYRSRSVRSPVQYVNAGIGPVARPLHSHIGRQRRFILHRLKQTNRRQNEGRGIVVQNVHGTNQPGNAQREVVC